MSPGSEPQWYSTCLVFSRPWVPSLAPRGKKRLNSCCGPCPTPLFFHNALITLAFFQVLNYKKWFQYTLIFVNSFMEFSPTFYVALFKSQCKHHFMREVFLPLPHSLKQIHLPLRHILLGLLFVFVGVGACVRQVLYHCITVLLPSQAHSKLKLHSVHLYMKIQKELEGNDFVL
jgi:hypothetical protein